MKDNRETLLNELRPYADGMAEFEAPPSRKGKTVGEVKEFQRFHALAEDYFTRMALFMWENFSGNHLICGRGTQRKWLQVMSGNRGVYIPFFGEGDPAASVPWWLNPVFSRVQMINRLKRAEADPSLAGLIPARKSGFIFKHCVGLFEGRELKSPRRLIIIDYATGKSSDGEKLDGNAHERISYKMLQCIELAQVLSELKIKMDFAVFGNGAFRKYENRLYPSVFLHRQTLRTLFGGCTIDFNVETEEFLRFAETVYDWLALPLRTMPVIRRRVPESNQER